jgi:outer membrane protein assembly factor BamD (BamD/ComL family)
MKIINRVLLGALSLCLVSLTGCNTVPKSVSADLNPRQIVQRGHEASDKGNFPAAIYYYQTAMERAPSDMSVVCSCEYEIAFIQYKEKKYELAKAGFENLLNRYNDPDSAVYPQEFRILAEKILKKTNQALAAQAKKKAKPTASPAPSSSSAANVQ